ncbi:glycosyltransferase family 2 protein [Oleiharenicola lentus]|uniref:glycosyltransferase family 2 protein n=1 Tax=Oleiharenicola lentus TaxID=2508720 RepID=UPI003F674BC2
MSPLVSIIIPCYNAERWLAQTLESALAQSWPHKEIILVDDGSTDRSLEVAQKFSGASVQIVAQKNSGASAARNHGLRLARGEFIQFLDADDLISPDKIEVQLALLETKPAETIASCAWGRFQENIQAAQFVDDAVYRDFTPVDFLVLAGNENVMMHPSCWLVPRSVVSRAGEWDQSLSLNDDGEYFSRVLLASSGVSYASDPRAKSYYRSGLAGSLSQQRGERARRSQFRSLELISEHLLTAEDSARTRQAAANSFQRFIYDFYPAPSDLMEKSAQKVATFGGSNLGSPPMGPKTALISRLVGWRNVWRLKHLLQK